MLAGLPQDALSQYLIAGEYLRAASDVLWLAGALEGQCAASVVLNRNEKATDINSLILPTKCAVNSSNLAINGLGSDVDETKFRNPSPLSEEEIVERLSEALRLYNKVSTHSYKRQSCIAACLVSSCMRYYMYIVPVILRQLLSGTACQ